MPALLINMQQACKNLQDRKHKMIRASFWPSLMCSLLIGVCSCKTSKVKSPEELRSRYAQALQDNDPDQVYELLSKQVQARMSRQEFRARWQDQAKERAEALNDLKKLDRVHQAPVLQGVTTHPEGSVIHWAYVGNRFVVVDGLPSLADRSTPQSTLRSFITAVRATDFSSLSQLLEEGLVEQIHHDWRQRADHIEDLLRQPDAVELSPDARQAKLRYEPGRAITLEQSPQGWRIIRLQ